MIDATHAPTRAADAPASDKPQEIARQAEELFARTLLKEVRKAMPEGGMLGGGQEGGMWDDLLDEELAKRIADTGGLGVGDQILRLLGDGGGPGPTPQPLHRPHAYPSHRAGTHDHTVTEGRISSTFGTRADPIHGRRKMHAGIDIAAPSGTPIRALRDGEVTFAGRSGGYGNLVVIDHGDGLESRYAHASRLGVKPGQRVEAGEELATVGATGRATGAHLHLEVRRDGRAVDPMPFLQRGATEESPKAHPDAER